MRARVLLCVAGLLLLLVAGNAAAHSTKGLSKALLNKDTLTVNDVALFVESYVMRDLYDDKNSRFIVRDFVAVKQEGNKALIDFVVYDKKENRGFPEKMAIARGKDGVWSYTPKTGAPAPMFTFVRKGRGGGGSANDAIMGGFAMVAAVLGVLVIRKKINSGSFVKPV